MSHEISREVLMIKEDREIRKEIRESCIFRKTTIRKETKTFWNQID
jgi:hypothetical protein